MLEALLVTLREGVEAALVVGIIVAFLRREGRERDLPAVWVGLAAAVGASFAGAFVLYRWAINEEAFEGVLYLASAGIVSTMLVWMWRHARGLAGAMRGSLAALVERRPAGGLRLGLFGFTFLMVFREGLETVLFLSALSLSTGGLLAFLGATAGVVAAVVFGVLFVRGSLRVDVGRFLKVTGIALAIFVVQLLLNGYHELSEAGWLPASPATMAAVGPLVRNEVFFIAAVLALPLLLLLVPGKAAPVPAATSAADNPAAARLARAAARRQLVGRRLGGVLGLGILAVLGLGFAYSQAPRAATPPTALQPAGNEVRLPVASVGDGRLHRFVVELDGRQVRFLAISLGDGERVATTFDACQICGSAGYAQEGSTLVCLHCSSAIFPPTLGVAGGCNPVPLPSRLEGDELVVALADLRSGAGLF
jgi:FTR1 family protein